jgi:hypothetical protein
VTWEFAGNLTRVDDNAGLFGGSVSIGDPFSGSYTFDSETPDSDPGSITRGLYENAVSGASGNFGAASYSFVSGADNVIEVLDFPGIGVRSYRALFSVEILGEQLDLSLYFQDPTGAVFLDDSLPVSPPDLEPLDLAKIELFDGSERLDVTIVGQFTTVIPEPATVVLLAVGALLTVRRRLRCVRARPYSAVDPYAADRGRVRKGRLLLIAGSVTSLVAAVPAIAVDCNVSRSSDECAINCDWPRCHLDPCGESADCNENRIPDECEVPNCKEVEVVFLMDTSGSVALRRQTRPRRYCSIAWV